MKQINELITQKEQNLKSLEQEKKNLEQSMANPSLLNSKGKEIENAENKIALLKDVLGLAEEAGDDSAKKILSDVKDHYQEMKQEFAGQKNKGQALKDLNKLTDLIDDVIDNELSAADKSSKNTESAISEDLDLPDYSSFDDTG